MCIERNEQDHLWEQRETILLLYLFILSYHFLIHMWNLKTQTQRYREQIGGFQRGGALQEGEMGKRVSCMVIDGNWTCGGDHL